MPLPDEQLDTAKTEELKVKETKPAVNTKLIIYGLPVFIVQLVAVYFITANILMKKFENHAEINSKEQPKSSQAVDTTNKQAKTELGKYIYNLDDIIVNPANTDGKRLLLTSIGIDLKKGEMQNDLKTREAIVKDVIISTLSGKDIQQLNNTTYRDTLKIEIANKLTQMIPSISINTIYFSKYILQ